MNPAKALRLILPTGAALVLFASVFVNFSAPGSARQSDEQLFEGNFGVALTILPEADQVALRAQIATEEAARTMYPTADPFAPTEVWPTPPSRPTGIMGGDGFLPGRYYYTTNAWQGFVGADFVRVNCVTETWNWEKSWLLVQTIYADGTDPRNIPDHAPWYFTPSTAGAISIVAADGFLLTLSAERAPEVRFTFDVEHLTWQYPAGAPAVAAIDTGQPVPENLDPTPAPYVPAGYRSPLSVFATAAAIPAQHVKAGPEKYQ